MTCSSTAPPAGSATWWCRSRGRAGRGWSPTRAPSRRRCLRGLGAAEVLDHREGDFAARVADLDAVIDCHGSYGEASLPVLRPGGTLVALPSGTSAGLQELARRESKRATGFLVEPDPTGLAGISDLIEGGHLEVLVDRVFELEDVAAAHRRAEASHGAGKIVLRVQ